MERRHPDAAATLLRCLVVVPLTWYRLRATAWGSPPCSSCFSSFPSCRIRASSGWRDVREHVEVANRVYRYGTFVQALESAIRVSRPMGILLFLDRSTHGRSLLCWRMRLAMEPPARQSPRCPAIAIIGITLGTYATDDPRELGVNRPRARYGGAWSSPHGPSMFSRHFVDGVYVLSRAVARPELRLLRMEIGQFGHMSAATAILLAIGIYAAQAIASALWLRRFRFRSASEWMWRSSFGRRV